jgi:hypothetical protein
VVVEAGTGDSILSNSIYGNGGLGIQLSPGANHDQAAPVLQLGVSAAGFTVVAGTFHSTASTTFTLQFFASVAPNPSGFGDGQTLLGSYSVTTDINGNAKFTAVLTTPVPIGQGFLSATATNRTTNDTSQFAQDLVTVLSNSGGLPYIGVSQALLQQIQAVIATLTQQGKMGSDAVTLEALIASMLGL